MFPYVPFQYESQRNSTHCCPQGFSSIIKHSSNNLDAKIILYNRNVLMVQLCFLIHLSNTLIILYLKNLVTVAKDTKFQFWCKEDMCVMGCSLKKVFDLMFSFKQAE